MTRQAPIAVRLSRRQVVRNGCWGWRGSTDGRGYGQLSSRRGRSGSPEKAHRVSYECNVGEIPEGMVVRHRCDNPICTNPEHLELGTHQDNAIDCVARGRKNPVSAMNLKHDRALSAEQVAEISRIEFCAVNGRGHGARVMDVAKKYGVCVDLISQIKNGRYHV